MPPGKIEPLGYVRGYSGVTRSVSAWISCPTFSSIDIRRNRAVTRASVFESIRPWLFAVGQSAGLATPGGVCSAPAEAANARVAADREAPRKAVCARFNHISLADRKSVV